jgi:hypothetical protein
MEATSKTWVDIPMNALLIKEIGEQQRAEKRAVARYRLKGKQHVRQVPDHTTCMKCRPDYKCFLHYDLHGILTSSVYLCPHISMSVDWDGDDPHNKKPSWTLRIDDSGTKWNKKKAAQHESCKLKQASAEVRSLTNRIMKDMKMRRIRGRENKVEDEIRGLLRQLDGGKWLLSEWRGEMQIADFEPAKRVESGAIHADPAELMKAANAEAAKQLERRVFPKAQMDVIAEEPQLGPNHGIVAVQQTTQELVPLAAPLSPGYVNESLFPQPEEPFDFDSFVPVGEGDTSSEEGEIFAYGEEGLVAYEERGLVVHEEGSASNYDTEEEVSPNGERALVVYEERGLVLYEGSGSNHETEEVSPDGEGGLVVYEEGAVSDYETERALVVYKEASGSNYEAEEASPGGELQLFHHEQASVPQGVENFFFQEEEVSDYETEEDSLDEEQQIPHDEHENVRQCMEGSVYHDEASNIHIPSTDTAGEPRQEHPADGHGPWPFELGGTRKHSRGTEDEGERSPKRARNTAEQFGATYVFDLESLEQLPGYGFLEAYITPPQQDDQWDMPPIEQEQGQESWQIPPVDPFEQWQTPLPQQTQPPHGFPAFQEDTEQGLLELFFALEDVDETWEIDPDTMERVRPATIDPNDASLWQGASALWNAATGEISISNTRLASLASPLDPPEVAVP